MDKGEIVAVGLNENNEPIVSGRDLHEFLGGAESYTDWIKRMMEYGFTVNHDFISICELSEKTEGSRLVKRKQVDHILKLDMAKELAMIQRTEKGKQVRKYFIEVEKEYNSPEKIMARALKIAESTINNLQVENTKQSQLIGELKPRADYTDIILKSKDLVTVTQIAKDYGMSGQAFNSLLHDLKIQFKQSGQWLLYSEYHESGYTHSETVSYQRSDETTGVNMITKWTQKGRLFLYELLKNEGCLPNIER